MNVGWWEGLVLGMIQGLSEFLPISSSGHLVVVEGLLGVRPPGVLFEVLVHLATLTSVLVVYHRRVASLLVGLVRRDGPSWRYTILLAVATVPAALVGVFLEAPIERIFHSHVLVGMGFLLTAAILWSTRSLRPRDPTPEPGYLGAVGIGLAQALAIIPGVSRSGSTIAAALWGGVAPRPAAEFSFLMAVIVIAGSGLLEARKITDLSQVLSPGSLWAFAAALVSGIVAIRFLVALLRDGRFHRFAPYCLTLGAFTLLWFGLR